MGKHHVEQTGNATSDHDYGAAGVHIREPLAAQDTRQRLDECGIFVRHAIGQRKDAAVYVNGRHPNKFGKTTGVEIRPAESFANGVMATEAVMAGVAGNMMGKCHTVAVFAAFDPFSHIHDLAANLMSKY
jgi:hypothetical protein